MAVFTPSTQVILCSVPLEKDQKNQLDFASATAQYNYFYGTRQFTYTNFTYQRKDNTLRVPAEFDTLYKCNYVMYQNANFGTKWFYAFIDSMEYINQNCTALHLKTDVFQTWILSAVFKPSFVAREHVANDAPWAHTLPEPINTPEYKYNQLWAELYDSTPGNTNTYWKYCAYATPDSGDDDVRPATYSGGTYTEVTTYHIGHMRTPGYLFGSDNLTDFKKLIEFLVQKNYTISYTITIPSQNVTEYYAVKFGGGTFDPNVVYDFKIYGDGSTGPNAVNISAISTITINSHTVRNKKLNCYPYRFLQLTDDNDQKMDLKLELMNVTHDTANQWQGALNTWRTAGSAPAVICAPSSYAGKPLSDYSHSITLSSFPPVPYATDYFQQYCALHKSSFVTEQIKNAASLPLSIAGSGNVTGALMQGASSILNYEQSLSKYEDMMNHPPAAHNSPTGEPKYAANALRLKLYDVFPTAEYLDKIDSFFDFYGYNVSTVKTPQFTSRPYWNYIETKEINIEGDIPQDDMQELKDIFNKGVTVWHNTSYFLDYSRNNAPT